jgi:hypothetical protein
MSDLDYRTGGAVALRKAAALAEEAGKLRTAAWLVRCAQIVVPDGYDLRWPDAPVYKGAVVHVDAPGPDLKALTADQLDNLLKAIEGEQFEREND